MMTLRRIVAAWGIALSVAFSIAIQTRSVIAWGATVILALMPVMLAWGLATAPTKTIAEILYDAENR